MSIDTLYFYIDFCQVIKLTMERLPQLTNREQEILSFIKEGNTSLDIAEQLNITKNTVDTHRRNILKKTNSKSVFLLINSLNK